MIIFDKSDITKQQKSMDIFIFFPEKIWHNFKIQLSNVVNFCFKAVKSRQTIAELHQST